MGLPTQWISGLFSVLIVFIYPSLMLYSVQTEYRAGVSLPLLRANQLSY